MHTAPFAQLQSFLAVARHKSFSAAARELRVSRSAVSQAVGQLEAQLRVVLLARTTRSVSLTDAGRRLVDSAGPSLGQLMTALTEVSAQPGETVGIFVLNGNERNVSVPTASKERSNVVFIPWLSDFFGGGGTASAGRIINGSTSSRSCQSS